MSDTEFIIELEIAKTDQHFESVVVAAADTDDPHRFRPLQTGAQVHGDARRLLSGDREELGVLQVRDNVEERTTESRRISHARGGSPLIHRALRQEEIAPFKAVYLVVIEPDSAGETST